MKREFDQNMLDSNENRGGEKTDSMGNENNPDDTKISKEEINERFDVKFAKSQGSGTQHLVPSDQDDAICRVSLSSDAILADSPGPFDPICKRCRRRILGKKIQIASGQTLADLRDWLADEVEGVEETSYSNTRRLTKTETAAVIEHIRQLNGNSQ